MNGQTYALVFKIRSNIDGNTPYQGTLGLKGFIGALFSATAPTSANTTTGSYGSIVNSFAPTGRSYIPAGDSGYTATVWTAESLYYTANGTEKFITIGNFSPGANSTNYSYFYIDEVNFLLILPVTLTNFTGTANGNNVLLGWATTAESKNMGFKIERSTDGTNYTAIGFVSSEAKDGNSSANLPYHFTDNAPYNGANYYRLNQIGFDRTSTLSNTIEVDSRASSTIVRFSPNPATDMITITGVATGSKFAVTDMQGRIVLSYVTTRNINVAGLAKGEYLLQIFQNGNLQTFKFIKE